MKKTICILLIALMVLSLCACSGSEEDVTENEIVEEQNVNSGPVAKTVTYEESKNNLGARYTFTLEEFNTMLNEECKSLGDATVSEYFELDNWQKMSDTLVDDNGIEYTSYYYATDVLTITAAVENESGKVMNLGCGSSYEEFANGSADFQYNIMFTSAILAMVAGGYDDDALEYLYYIFFDSAKYDESFFYNNSVYMMNLSSANDGTDAALLFMMSPCKDEILKEWELTDYSSYENASVLILE